MAELENISKLKRKTVDIRLSIIVGFFTFCALLTLSLTAWHLAYEVMIDSLEERALSLYYSVEDCIEKETFYSINTPDDITGELYKTNKDSMLLLKQGAGVMYLYTAKVDDNGDFIYVIDGLEKAGDFRYPGDYIEDEIIDEMRRALNNEMVMPDEILHTNWGDIFMAYLPVHGNEKDVIGVVGIEFDATSTYNAYTRLLRITIFVTLLLSALAVMVSTKLFHHFTAPLYETMSSEDSPSGLKNRSAYTKDLISMTERGKTEGVGIIVTDINGLKEVNARLGHNSGDKYIRLVADILKQHMPKETTAYRSGGDEFILLIKQANEEEICDYIARVSVEIKSQNYFKDMRCSISSGWSIFEPERDYDLEDTHRRADEAMYAEKKRQRKKMER